MNYYKGLEIIGKTGDFDKLLAYFERNRKKVNWEKISKQVIVYNGQGYAFGCD